MPMRVAMVTGSYPPVPCGIGDYAERLILELRQAGADVEVVTTRCNEAPARVDVCHELENWKLRNWRRAIDWISSQSFDVLHFQYPGKAYGHLPDLAGLTREVKKRLPDLPVVVTVHEFGVTPFLRKLTVASIVTFADSVILTAQSERRLYDRLLPWVRRKIKVIRLSPSISVAEFGPEHEARLNSRYDIGPDNIVIAHFGFVQSNKGAEELLKAFRAVSQRHPQARLLMMSSFEPASNAYHRRLADLTDTLCLRDSVIWTGFLTANEVSHHLSWSDIAVFPFTDGATMRRTSFMAAMSHGLPTITTQRDADMEELGLTDREDVLLTSAPADPRDLAQHMTALVDSAPLRAKLREGALRWACPLQWDHVAARTLEVYHSVVR